MNQVNESQATIVRTERGLTIADTRITLYSIMDYVKDSWSPQRIQDLFDLTDKQIMDVMNYIEEHCEEVEAEYQLVLEQAEESRRYWAEYNRERLTRVTPLPPNPEREALRAKLKAWKEELGIESDYDPGRP